MTHRFSFNLFRLNIVDFDGLLPAGLETRLRSDDDVRRVLQVAVDSALDQVQTTRTAVFKWSLRAYIDLGGMVDGRDLIYMVLARSLLEKHGVIVTDDGMDVGVSSSNPPLA